MADHERIWLQNAKDAEHQCEGRLWCQDKVWPNDPEDGEPTEYIRADLARASALPASDLVERLEAVSVALKNDRPYAAAAASEAATALHLSTGDWAVDDTRAAQEVLSALGFSSSPSLEPGDHRRDRVAKIIAMRVATALRLRDEARELQRRAQDRLSELGRHFIDRGFAYGHDPIDFRAPLDRPGRMDK